MAGTDIILGLLLLLTGRKLFWLSVAIFGFLAGVQWAAAMGWQVNEVTMIFLAILFGILGAALAIPFQWVAILLLGFLGGGYFVTNILLSLGLGHFESAWWLFFLGGIMGVLLMSIAFDWALIGITSLLGAMLIVEHLSVDGSLRAAAFICLLLAGIFVQCISSRFLIGEPYK